MRVGNYAGIRGEACVPSQCGVREFKGVGGRLAYSRQYLFISRLAPRARKMQSRALLHRLKGFAELARLLRGNLPSWKVTERLLEYSGNVENDSRSGAAGTFFKSS
ncbi:hypothetical protein MRX96_055313 [Rhipicephalus microplus]